MNWGLFLASLVCGIGIIQASLQEVPGHYRLFVQAAQNLWSGLPTYGVPLVGNYYFYSPACGLFFFGPFSLLPERIGLWIYLLCSAAVLLTGIGRFTRLFLPLSEINWFWIWIAQPLYSSISVHKPEVMMTGILLHVSAWLIEGAHRNWVTFLLAMIANWKLQPLPSIALLGLGRVLLFKDFRWSLWMGAFLGLWFAFPFVVRPFAYLLHEHQVWKDTLSYFTSVSFTEFDNVFSFLKNTLGIDLTYFQGEILSLLAGVGCAAWVAYLSKKICPGLKSQVNSTQTRENVLLCLAIGAGYTVLFSPLNQVQAYLLLIPTYFLAFLYLKKSTGNERRFWIVFMAVFLLIMTFAYSDLVPDEMRNQLRHMTVRAGATLILMIVLCVRSLLERKLESRFDFRGHRNNDQ